MDQASDHAGRHLAIREFDKHTLPREFGAYAIINSNEMQFGRNQPVCE